MFMRWLKQYLGLLFPLIALLVGIESIILINRALNQYEGIIGRNYAIIIVAKEKLSLNELGIEEAVGLDLLDSSAVLSDLNNEFKNLGALNITLPFFYSLKLDSFPSQAAIKNIESHLKSFEHILRVESFSKTHSQTYRLLVLLKACIIVLSGLVFILSILLMIKQIEVWRFEHSERMEIMTYLGAPGRVKNAPLYRLALIDSIISSLVVIVGMMYLSKHPRMISLMQTLEIDIFGLKNYILDFGFLLFGALFISMLSVCMVILYQKEP